jgi:hypothetical protein
MTEQEYKDKVKTVDIGYHLDYCGHQMVENVYYGGYTGHDKGEARHVFCTTVDGANQYTFPLESIDFIVPHIERCVMVEEGC